MQTQVPKPIKDRIMTLPGHMGYESLKAMNLVLLLQFMDEKPYKTDKFNWITKLKFLERDDMVTFNVLVPPSADHVPDQIRREVKGIYPKIKLASFLLTALIWWLKKHDALPAEFSSIK
jgi:hypothetical protein